MSDKELNYTKFADYVIQKWQKKVQALGIVHTKALFDSFTQEVHTNANGDANLIIFTFKYYGRFVDMGVGKGISKEDSGLIGSRKPKRWFTPILYQEVGKLSKLLASDLEFKINQAFTKSLQD